MKNKKERKLASVILALFNGERYLREQVESVLSQSYGNIELIIIDDKSGDGSPKLADELVLKDKRIRMYKNRENIGVVANFLKGLSDAKGEFIFFCDQDDYWQSNKVESLVKLLERDSANMLAYSDVEICDEKLSRGNGSFWKATGIGSVAGNLKEKAFLKNIAPGCSMAFRKEVRDMIVGLPPRPPFMHDHLALVVSCALGKVVCTKDVLVKYRQHGANNIGAFYNSIINKEAIIKSLQEKLNFFKTSCPRIHYLDLQRLENFCHCLRSNDLAERLSFSDYYLFLRNNHISDKFLGLLECLSPFLYDRIRLMAKRARVYKDSSLLWAMRIFFIAWVIIVLWNYTKVFIVHKLIGILG